jgi:2-iminobutanoate/2-iminopropanoate deaminase
VWADVARTTIFLTDLGNFGAVNALYEGAIGTHRPARTTIGVAALPAAALVEIECWVYLPDVAGPEVVLAEEPT